MADESIYVIRLAAWLGQALGESAPLFADFSTEDLGVDLPAAVVQASPVVSALQHAEAAANKVRDAATELETVAGSESELQILAEFVRFGAALGEFYAALDAIVVAVGANVTPATVPDAAQRAAAAAFAGTLAKRMSDYALASAITDHAPEFGFVLRLAGLLDWRYLPPQPGQELSSDHVRKTLQLDRLRVLISDPVQHLRNSLGWGDPAFDPTNIFRLVSDFFGREDSMQVGVQGGEPFLRIGSFLIRRDSTVAPPGLVLALLGELEADIDERTPLNNEWGFGVKASLRVAGSVSGQVRPPLTLRLLPLTGEITGELRAFFDRNPEAQPFDILGGTGLLSISANNLTAGVGLKSAWSVGERAATIVPLFFADVNGVTVKVGTSESDGFIGNLLSNAAIEGEFDLGLEWQADTGLRITASGGIEIALPIHKQLGPIEFEVVYIALRILSDGTLSLETSTGITGKLGPLAAAVDRIGALLDLRFAAGTDAKFGPFDLNLRFKPPTGVGLVVDAGVVKGGGYLFFDSDKGEYAGALELMFSGIVSLKAIGLITTKMPDGSKGFSLLIIITAEFGTGIQLGFGFTLVGVGGLLGLNRTVRLEPLADGVRTGAVNNIMFPQDVVANAPRIISDLRTIFPPEQGKFLIGPMAKLGWGTPTLISLSLGIIIEIPGNLAILGVLRCILPTEDAAILTLQVAFVGAIEFDKKRLWLFAGLFESRVLFITLEGEMGVLAAFGDDANFVVSVGGFHPRFTPPPLPFPIPKRLAFDLLNEPGERIRVEGYFAVTTNTAQFGAHAELVFGFDDFGLHGHLGFDALFQFSPFYFIIQIGADLSLDAFGVGLLSVDLDFSLEGPTPYRAHGRGSVSLLFFDISADFDITWGETRDTTLPPIDIMPPLAAEFDKLENWKAFLPANTNLLVSLRHLDPATDGLVLHPLGTLRITQRYVPLDSNIDKVGTQKPNDAKHFTLQVTSADLVKVGDVPEQFAPAQFHDMSNADKLSKPAYAPEHGGLELSASGQQLNSSQVVKRIARYEQIIVDTNFKRFARKFRKYSGVLFEHFLGGNAISKSTLSVKYKQQMQPFKETIKAGNDSFAVAFTDNNKAYKDEAVFASVFAAEDYMAQAITDNPELADSLHVIPHAEVNRAA